MSRMNGSLLRRTEDAKAAKHSVKAVSSTGLPIIVSEKKETSVSTSRVTMDYNSTAARSTNLFGFRRG
jgi:hypothetical protein